MAAADESLFSILGDRVYTSARRLIRPSWVDFGYYAIFSITPEMPRHLWLSFDAQERQLALGRAFLATLPFTFGITALLCLADGRLLPDADPLRYQFMEDTANVLLYLLVCPAYVALCTGLVGVAARFWVRRAEQGVPTEPLAARLRPRRTTLALCIMLLLSSLSITQYQYDLLYSPDLPTQYWFLDQVGQVRVLNRAGFYYLLLNFGLLFITLAGILSYLSLAVQAVRDARRMAPEDCGDIPAALAQFENFQFAVVLGRLLVLCYIANMLMWGYSPMSSATQANLAFATLMVLIFGVIGTRLPQDYVAARLRRLREQCSLAGAPAEDLALIAVGPRWMRLLANSFRTMISISFAFLIFPALDPDDWLKQQLALMFG